MAICQTHAARKEYCAQNPSIDKLTSIIKMCRITEIMIRHINTVNPVQYGLNNKVIHSTGVSGLKGFLGSFTYEPAKAPL